MKISIGYRTIKTAIGTGVAIALAEWLGLQFYVSAGIITILCVKPTRKKSYQTAWERFLACLIGMVFAGVLFETLGYKPWTLALLLLLLIPTTVYLKATEGIVTSSVIILHFYALKKINLDIIANEMGLIVIGIGIALLVNLYMPNVEKELRGYQQKIENNFRKILHEFSIYLRAGESDWDGKEIIETSKMLKEAKILALKDLENQFYEQDINYYRYFDMREKQFEILERIMPTVSSLNHCCSQGLAIADFLDRVANAVHPGNTATLYLDELERLRKQFKQQPLPKDRQEFETRAALLHFVNEMRRYLIIKRDLMKKKQKMQEQEKGWYETRIAILQRLRPSMQRKEK